MTEATGTTTTIYSGNYIYQNNVLQMINQPEGYLEPNGQGGYDYGYRLKVGAQRKSRLCGNHLGNIRLTFVDFDHNGSIALSEITEENNYYPFGLKHQGYNFVVSSNTNAVANKFKYNSKELNDELGLDWYDYGFRMYDPELGRWHVIDGHAESYFSWSPYNYVMNNPINFIDFLGLDPVYRNGKYYETDENGEEYEVDWNYVSNWIHKNDGIAAKYTFSTTSGKTEIVSTEKGNTGLSFILNGKEYTANSYMTLMGRDDKNNSVGDFSGIETWSMDEILMVLGHGSWVIYDKYYGGVEKAMFGESVGGRLDYKNIAYDIFGLNRKSLIEINGVVYNANEAGNFLWGMVLEYHGGILSPNAIAQIATKRGQNRDDERWEQKAITAGRAYALGLLQRPDLKQRILENRLDYR